MQRLDLVGSCDFELSLLSHVWLMQLIIVGKPVLYFVFFLIGIEFVNRGPVSCALFCVDYGRQEGISKLRSAGMVLDWSRNSRGRHGNTQMCKDFSHPQNEKIQYFAAGASVRDHITRWKLGVCIWMRSCTAGARATWIFAIKVYAVISHSSPIACHDSRILHCFLDR